MSCVEVNDNRETCVNVVPSSCVPYTGYISDLFKAELCCRPNINDILKKIQDLLDVLKANTVDNTGLVDKCFEFDPAVIKQNELNQLFIDELCKLKSLISNDGDVMIDASTLAIAINLLCLQDAGCEPKETYTFAEIFNKLVTAYCGLLERVQNIETLLNI